MSDGSASGQDDELPPDPWAGLDGPPPPPQPPGGEVDRWEDARWRPGQEPAARPPGWHAHPSAAAPRDGDGGGDGDGDAHRPPPRRTVWHHPATWAALLALAVLLLVTALLEPRGAPPPSGDPDAVTAAGTTEVG